MAFVSVALTVMLLTATMAAAEIREGACYCYAGANQISETPCQCACPEPWLPPRCNFKAATTVELKMYVRTSQFSSENFVTAINADVAGVTSASFRRKTGTAVTFNGAAAFDVRIVVTGSDVAALLAAVEAQTAPIQALGIIAADLSEKRAADVFEPDRLVIYTHGGSPGFTVTASSAGWFLSALVLIVLLPVVELCCCLSYSSADIEVLEQEEADARAVEKYREAAEAQAAAHAAAEHHHGEDHHQPTEGVVVVDASDGAYSPKEQPPGVPPPHASSPPPPAAAGEDGEMVAAMAEPSQSAVFRPDDEGAEMRPTGAATPPGHVGGHHHQGAMTVESCAY